MEKLNYGKERMTPTWRRWLFRGSITIVIAAVIFVAGTYVPLHSVDRAFMCRTCGHVERRSTLSVGHFTIWSHTKSGYREAEDIYIRLIGTPHQHQMFPYAVVSEYGNLWWYSGIGEGGPHEPVLATSHGLLTLAMIADAHPELSRETIKRIYAEIQKCSTNDDVQKWWASFRLSDYRGPHTDAATTHR